MKLNNIVFVNGDSNPLVLHCIKSAIEAEVACNKYLGNDNDSSEELLRIEIEEYGYGVFIIEAKSQDSIACNLVSAIRLGSNFHFESDTKIYVFEYKSYYIYMPASDDLSFIKMLNDVVSEMMASTFAT